MQYPRRTGALGGLYNAPLGAFRVNPALMQAQQRVPFRPVSDRNQPLGRMVFPNGMELGTGAGLGPLAQAEMERHGARPVMPQQITDAAMRRIDAGGTSMEAIPANLPRPVPVATPSPETMPAPSGAALGGLQDTPALTDSDRNHAVMMAGLRMMQAASRPGATALGALADGGVTGMQTADALRQRNIQSAAAQQQAERDDLRFRMDIERHNADMAKSRRPEIQKFYDELGREISGYLDDRGNVVQVGGAKSGSGEAPKTITDGTGQVWAYNPGTGVFDVKVGAPKPNGGLGGSSGLPANAQMVEYLVGTKIAPDRASAWEMVQQRKIDPAARARLITDQMKLLQEANEDPYLADDDRLTQAEIKKEAEARVDAWLGGNDGALSPTAPPQQAPGADMAGFDPNGSGYDYARASAAGMGPDGTGEDAGHWGSVAPTTRQEQGRFGLPTDSYILLKGKDHETWQKAVNAEKERGFKVVSLGGRYYSVPKGWQPPSGSGARVAEQGEYPDASQMDPSEWQEGEVYSVPGKGNYRYVGKDRWAPVTPGEQGGGAPAPQTPPVRPIPVPSQPQQAPVPVTQPQATPPGLPLTPPDMSPSLQGDAERRRDTYLRRNDAQPQAETPVVLTADMARADLARLQKAQAMADKDPHALQNVMKEIRMIYGGMEEFRKLLREVPGPDAPLLQGH